MASAQPNGHATQGATPMEAAEKARNEDGAAAEKTLNDEDEEDEEAQEGSPDVQRHLLDIYAEDVQQVSVNTLRMCDKLRGDHGTVLASN